MICRIAELRLLPDEAGADAGAVERAGAETLLVTRGLDGALRVAGAGVYEGAGALACRATDITFALRREDGALGAGVYAGV